VSKEPGSISSDCRGNRAEARRSCGAFWHDAKFVADQIAIQRAYSDYQGEAAIVQAAAE
jgi:putative flavoprotein involved in K+ transport